MSLADRVRQIEEEVSAAARKSGRPRSDITLLAVSKTFSAEKVREAHQAGLKSFGENYLQEAEPKVSALRDLNLDWHFIGHLQSNKVKHLIGQFQLIHSIDRLSLAEEISRRVDANPDINDRQKILIEVNLGNEESKSGVALSEVLPLLDAIQDLPFVQICGLMAMPPLDWPADQLRRAYNHLRDERDRWASKLSAPHSLVELSMGTSHDFAEAIAAGSTIVRIGTRIFGEREG